MMATKASLAIHPGGHVADELAARAKPGWPDHPGVIGVCSRRWGYPQARGAS